LTSNNAPTTASAEVRNRDLNGDPIRESLIHIGRTPNIKWEVAVPNGSYRVVITAGDPNVESTLNTHHIIKAEGVTVIDYMPNSSAGLRTDVANITVSDGRLTIDGNSGINSKLVALAIQSTDILQHPAVIQSTPADGATNVNTGTSISANFIATPNQNNQGLGFIDNSTITSNTVKLFELNGATAIWIM